MLKSYYDSVKESINSSLSKIRAIKKNYTDPEHRQDHFYHISYWYHETIASLYKITKKKLSAYKRRTPWGKPYWLWWQFLFSKSDFLLTIRPKAWQLHGTKHLRSLSFPPPGYGVPLGYKTNNYQPKKEYALFLLPGALQLWFLAFTISLPIFLFLPLIRNKTGEDWSSYLGMIFIYLLVSLAIYYILYKKIISPSLTSVWEKWPIPAYELFLSVPHSVHISRCDNPDKKYKPIKKHVFWRPDVKSAMYRQSTEHSPDMQTLQELILNLAIFEFLFHKQEKQSSTKNDKLLEKDTISTMKTIREQNWYLYLFAPVWINFLLISLSLLMFVSLTTNVQPTYPNQTHSWSIIANFPYNFLFAIFTWFILTAFYFAKVLNSLSVLSKKVQKGYFNAHLELIPQQILNELSYIPSHGEIETAMLHLRKMLGWISSVALIGLMAVLEVLSQAYGDSTVIFNFLGK